MSQYENRIGKFKASRELVVSGWKDAQHVFANLVPVAITWDWDGTAIYTAFCPEFEDIPQACEPPFYDVIISKEGDQVSVQFKRQ